MSSLLRIRKYVNQKGRKRAKKCKRALMKKARGNERAKKLEEQNVGQMEVKRRTV